jgi:hypothetical protein
MPLLLGSYMRGQAGVIKRNPFLGPFAFISTTEKWNRVAII